LKNGNNLQANCDVILVNRETNATTTTRSSGNSNTSQENIDILLEKMDADATSTTRSSGNSNTSQKNIDVPLGKMDADVTSTSRLIVNSKISPGNNSDQLNKRDADATSTSRLSVDSKNSQGNNSDLLSKRDAHATSTSMRSVDSSSSKGNNSDLIGKRDADATSTSRRSVDSTSSKGNNSDLIGKRDAYATSTSRRSVDSTTSQRSNYNSKKASVISVQSTTVTGTDKYFVIDGEYGNLSKARLISRSNQNTGFGTKVKKYSYKSDRNKKSKWLVEELLGRGNFMLPDKLAIVKCSTTDTIYSGNIFCVNKNDVDRTNVPGRHQLSTNDEIDKLYEWRFAFQSSQHDLYMDTFLVKELISRDGTDKLPYIKLPLFDYKYTDEQICQYNRSQHRSNNRNGRNVKRRTEHVPQQRSTFSRYCTSQEPHTNRRSDRFEQFSESNERNTRTRHGYNYGSNHDSNDSNYSRRYNNDTSYSSHVPQQRSTFSRYYTSQEPHTNRRSDRFEQLSESNERNTRTRHGYNYGSNHDSNDRNYSRRYNNDTSYSSRNDRNSYHENNHRNHSRHRSRY